jgi:hypothetical protein
VYYTVVAPIAVADCFLEQVQQFVSLPMMTKITQIEDRSAASAWSPIREHADVIAIGAKVR